MRKKAIRKIRMRKLTKIIITIFVLLAGIQLYGNLAILGSMQDKTKFDEIMLLLGWLWIIVGQFITLNFVWEK